tara:strand:- start:163 stop:372 length:210 start_codon:yes stop_codon:yes gene_type:complete
MGRKEVKVLGWYFSVMFTLIVLLFVFLSNRSYVFSILLAIVIGIMLLQLFYGRKLTQEALDLQSKYMNK